MPPRRPVTNAGTYQMGRPVNQTGGSARNRPVANAGTATNGALQRLAVGRTSTPAAPVTDWAAIDGGSFGSVANSPAVSTPTASRQPSLEDWMAIDGGSFDTMRRSPSSSSSSPTSVPSVSTSTASPAAATSAATAAPVEPKVNPLAALYGQLFADLGSQRSSRDEFWTGQNTDLANRYQTASDNQAAAMAAAMQTLNNGVNPYQQITTPASTTTGNPLAEYMQATGVDPSQVNSLVALNSANNAQYDNAVNNSLAQLGAAYDQANQSRLGDLNVMNAGFRQDIDAQRNALAAQMGSQQAGENAGFDQRQFEAMQAQIADNEAFSANNENRQMQLFQNILGSYGDSLDPQSLVNLVTAFAKSTGTNPASLMPVGGA